MITARETKLASDIQRAIREVPDFPKKGIAFKDITPVLKDPVLLKKIIESFSRRYASKKIDAVICVEARGFILGSAVAHAIGAGFVPVRKKGKLPYKTYQASYELEYGKDTLEIHQDALKPGARVLIMDDLLATGGTTRAVIELVRQLGARIVEVAYLLELSFLAGRQRLKDHKIFALVTY